MPRITQFDAPELGLRPTETGITATAAAARRVGAEYSEAAAAQQASARNIVETIQSVGEVALRFQEHQELSTGSVRGAEMLDNLTASKDARIKSLDPRDPAYGQKVEATVLQWREETLGPALENFSKGFITTKGQQFAQNFVASTQKSMFAHTTADISTAAGIGIANNIKTFANISSNTALRDPTMVPQLLQDTDRSVAGLVGSSPLKGTHGAKFQAEILEKTKDQIVKAGAIGAIQKAADPEAEAQVWIGKYPQHLSGQEALQLATNARQQIRAREHDARIAEQREKEVRKEVSDQAVNQYLIDIRNRDPKVAKDPLAQAVLNDPNLLKSDRIRLDGYIERQLKPETEARISNRTFIGFLSELQPGQTVDDQDILKRVWAARVKEPGEEGSLTEAHFEKLRREIEGRKTPEGLAISSDRGEFFKRYAPLIDPTFGVGSLEAKKMDDAIQDAKRRERDLRNKGLDPHLVYDNSSEHFFGKPENLSKYRPSQQERMQWDAREKAERNKKEPTVSPTPAPPVVKNKSDFDKLPPGTQFTGPDGRPYRKPG